jgi:hypothetical protein
MAEIQRKSSAAPLPEVVSGGVLASLLGCSERQVRQWGAEGVIERDGRGRYLLLPSVRAVVKRALAAGNAELDRERVDFQKVRAERLRLEIAEKRRQLIPIEEASAAISGVVGALKSKLIGLPARVTRDVAIRKTIEAEIFGALNAAAKDLEALARRAERGEAISIDEPDDGEG